MSTGNSLDCSPTDEPILKANEAAVKDMEGAAIAYTAQLLGAPLIAIKSVTDIVDGEHPTRACPCRPSLASMRASHEHACGENRVWKAATSKADPRQKQDWISKCLQGGRVHPLAARGVATRCCFSPTLSLWSFSPNASCLVAVPVPSHAVNPDAAC